MQEIEAAVGKNHNFAACPRFGDQSLQLVKTLQLA
jgi:hypothetical protein